MVDGLRMDGLVRVVGTCGQVRKEVFSTWGWSYYFVFRTIIASFGIHREYEDSSSDVIDIM